MSPETGGTATILVVEDVPTNWKILEHALRSAGYDVCHAATGREAIRAGSEYRPDLILLDILLPDTDGYAICEKFKRDRALRAIPIIFISTLDGTFDKVKAFESGGIDYVTKPFQPAELIARVRTHLELSRLQQERESIINELRNALEQVRLLEGLIPICSHCKKVRDDQGYWSAVEVYVSEHTDAIFSHGVCPDCVHKHHPGHRSRHASKG